MSIYVLRSPAENSDVGCTYDVIRQAVPLFHNVRKKAVFIGINSR